jgi:glycosyltransferase involved in cell wall biosynthesis
LFLGELEHDLVQSAYAAASAHVLVGFGETPGLANLEAAAQGCPIVVSNRGAERDYFGDLAYYADPLDPNSIRDAVQKAVISGRDERTKQLQRKVLETYTWDQVAEATAAAYREYLFGEAKEEQ